MKQIGNLAIVCARRKDATLRIEQGRVMVLLGGTYCFAVAAGTMAALPGCSVPTCTTRAPVPPATSGAVPLISRSTETLDTETLTAKR